MRLQAIDEIIGQVFHAGQVAGSYAGDLGLARQAFGQRWCVSVARRAA